jgi:hypothetical protein
MNMGRWAPVLWLLALAACAAEQTTPTPPIVAPVSGPAVRVKPFTTAPPATAPALVMPRSVAPPTLTPAPNAPGARQAAAYQENLKICLDGRWFAFCDHDQLTRYDAIWVRRAEYEANMVTCIDPQWQHLCRPELLP